MIMFWLRAGLVVAFLVWGFGSSPGARAIVPQAPAEPRPIPVAAVGLFPTTGQVLMYIGAATLGYLALHEVTDEPFILQATGAFLTLAPLIALPVAVFWDAGALTRSSRLILALLPP